MNDLGFEIRISVPFDKAINLLTEALKEEGFGILTEIDVKKTLKKKLDIDFRPYKIFGACNPPLAHKALTNKPEIGLLLPCNVTVELDDSGDTIIRLLNPQVMAEFGDLKQNQYIIEVADEAFARISRVATKLREA
jgi:uncharacterized protein (DUF302 family)